MSRLTISLFSLSSVLVLGAFRPIYATANAMCSTARMCFPNNNNSMCTTAEECCSDICACTK